MKKLLFCLLSIFLLCTSMISVYAAEYPLGGPNIVIDFDGEDDSIYVTLLCETKDPVNDRYSYLSWPEKYSIQNYDSIRVKFEQVAESNDYYFVDSFVQLTKDYSKLEWYGKTTSFKILIYSSDTDSFLISDTIPIKSSYLSKYHVHFDEEIIVESVDPYPTLFPLCTAVLIVSFLVRFILSFFFKYHQSKLFNNLLIEIISVSLLYSFLLAVMTYYEGKIAFIVIEFLCFWVLLIVEYAFVKLSLSVTTHHFLYSFLCNILHYLFCFQLFNSYIW